MAGAVLVRDAGPGQQALHVGHVPLLRLPQRPPLAALQQPDGGDGGGEVHGGQGGGEDEAGGVLLDEVHRGGRRGDVATHAAESLA